MDSASQPPIDRQELGRRHERLDRTRAALKSYFVGIDAVIDELIDAIRVWYLMPEVLTRPVIVNLWGMTGVGKTDLVRRLVKEIDFQERFAEVELHTNDSEYFLTSVAEVLESHDLTDGLPAILLFDEVQRFSTIDNEGKPIRTSNFLDFWELLSDGRLARRKREDLDYRVADILVEMEERRRMKKDSPDIVVDDRIGTWVAQSTKRALGIRTSLEDLARMRQSELVKLIQAAKKSRRAYEPVDHSKTLIVVSGNLDDAFSMAAETTEADVDADIFHAFAAKVSIVDVKRALSTRFKPEQVSRFGNVHILSRSLTRADFERLIERELRRVIETQRERFGVAVTIDDSVARLVYRNGVFPVQGVRPVFSSVADIVESNLANFVFEAVVANATEIHLEYDDTAKQLRATIRGGDFEDGRVIERDYVGRLDKVRESNLDDSLANVCVHEAGHAVVYCIEFGLAPLQLTAQVASSSTSGFTFSHDIEGTRSNLLARIRVLLAGGLAEEAVFGADRASTGRRSDRMQATQHALDFFRSYAFDEKFQAYYGLDDEYEMDRKTTDAHIERLLATLVTETREILEKNRDFMLSLSKTLQLEGRLGAPRVAEVARGFGFEVSVEPEGYRHVPEYGRLLDASGDEDVDRSGR